MPRFHSTVISIPVAWKAVLNSCKEVVGDDKFGADKLKKVCLSSAENIRRSWAASDTWQQQPPTVREKATEASGIVAERMQGRWLLMSGFSNGLGALGMVPVERLGSDKPADLAVSEVFFGRRIAADPDYQPTMTVRQLRGLMDQYFAALPTVHAGRGVGAREGGALWGAAAGVPQCGASCGASGGASCGACELCRRYQFPRLQPWR